MHRPGCNLSREPTKIEIGPVDPLHRHTQRFALVGLVVECNAFQMRHKRQAGVPRGIFRLFGDIVALETGNWHRGEIGNPDAGRKGGVIGKDCVVLRLIIIDQVHLVDRKHDVANTQQLGQIAMPPCLDEHTLARVDQDDRQVSGRCAGHHITGILFMPRAISDNELALFGGEEAVSNVNGDTLFAFGGKAIDEQGEVDLLALCPHAL